MTLSSTPSSRKGLLKFYASQSNEVQSHFETLPKLIDSDFNLNVAVAYTFFRLEAGQRLALYLGCRKVLRTDSELTWKAVDEFEMLRKTYGNYFARIYGVDLPKDAVQATKESEPIRDGIMHGGTPSTPDCRKAIAKALQYASSVNQCVNKKHEFHPFKADHRGLFGASKTLPKSTSRFVLKGIGFGLS